MVSIFLCSENLEDKFLRGVPGFFQKRAMDGCLGGEAFPGVRSALLCHSIVANFSAFYVVAAVAVMTRVDSVKNCNIPVHNTQASCVELQLRGQPSNHHAITVTFGRCWPHHLAQKSDLA